MANTFLGEQRPDKSAIRSSGGIDADMFRSIE